VERWHGSFRRRGGILAAAAGLALWAPGCELPSVPEWDTRWILPGFHASWDMDELLPPEVRVAPDGSAYLLTLPSAENSRTLRSLCPPCEILHGMVVPKPPFRFSIPVEVDFPPEVVSAEVRYAAVDLSVTNGLPFDPVRPGGLETGSLTVILRESGGTGRELATQVLDGAEQAFAPGSTWSTTILLEPGPVRRGLQVEVVVDSPLGPPVEIDLDRELAVSVDPSIIELTAVRAVIGDWEEELDPVTLRVGKIDDALLDRVLEGAVTFHTWNPLPTEVLMDLEIRTGSTVHLEEIFDVGPGDDVTRVSLRGSEVRDMLEHPELVLMGSGRVDGAGVEMDLVPGLQVSVEGMIDVVLRVGPTP
jgi:hypothetical protein